MNIAIDNETDLPVDTTGLVELARFVLDRLGIAASAELSVLLVDEATMTELNRQWMAETGPTDVLAFPMDELRLPGPGEPAPTGLLGDVVLCPTIAQAQGIAAGHGRDAELELLLVHGVLHLLGFDHAEPEEERAMFARQNDLLDQWRTNRPSTRSAE